MNDKILLVWLICQMLFDIVIIGGVGYLVYFRGVTGWALLLAIVVCLAGKLKGGWDESNK